MRDREYREEEIVVPQVVQDRVKRTLQDIRLSQFGVQPQSQNRKGGAWKKGVAIAASITVCSTLTVTAAVLSGWNDLIVKKYEVSEEQQKKLADENVATTPKVSDTVNGVTVSLEQCLVDDSFISLLFKVATPEEMVLQQETLFEGAGLLCEGKDFDYNSCGGEFVDAEGNPVEGRTGNELYYEMTVQYDEELEGKEMDAVFTNLVTVKADTGIDETFSEGSWKLNWILPATDCVKSAQVNIPVGDGTPVVKKIEISPISISVEYHYPHVTVPLEGEDEDGNAITSETFQEAPQPTEFELKDHSRVEIPMDGMGSCGYADENTEDYHFERAYGTILDPDEIVAVYFDDTRVEFTPE